MIASLILLASLAGSEPADTEWINPYPRVTRDKPATAWTFDRDAGGWAAQNHCTLTVAEGALRVEATGEDPYFHTDVNVPPGPVAVCFRARSEKIDGGAIYWATDRTPERDGGRYVGFPIHSDGAWHDYEVVLPVAGALRNVRIDPGGETGWMEFDRIALVRRLAAPVFVEQVRVGDDGVHFQLRNDSDSEAAFTANGKAGSLAAGASVEVVEPLGDDRPLQAVTFEVAAGDFPPQRRTVFVPREGAVADWLVLESAEATVQVAPDGSVARLLRGGQMVGWLAPIVHSEGVLPALQATRTGEGVVLQGQGVEVRLALAGKELAVGIRSDRPCEGPVVRAVGSLEQGLLAGVEYLGKGERSSSTLDIETPEHVRYAPDPLDVTMPLMAFVTDRGTLALHWTDNALQPVFATPNFFEGTPDHRMALQGNSIDATVLVDAVSLEEVILWAVLKQGLPPVPAPPRDREAQWALCMEALRGPLRTQDGWGHCVESHWKRQPYADIASTWWRLTGEVPELPALVPGGSHVENAAIYLVTGRAAEWLEWKRARAQAALKNQQADGSYRYDGPYARGHFENTASGVCAIPANSLLQYAQYTGDAESLAAAVKTLDYIKRFRTPRGAQVWEVPLHTPDQLASAYLVEAYVRGYELTGREDYLREARRWALTGIPFTYLWSKYPVMLYGTPPVLGATNWRAPNWIGLPVQWVGGVYAYSLAKLAPYDATLDWNQLARGILVTAEQMQYPDGPNAGLLPDSFELTAQQRRPWNINPCAVASLRMVLDGQLDRLAVAASGPHRVVAPFPVEIRDGQIRVSSRKGVPYQLVIDGRRIVEVTGQGDDVVSLE